jgi:hypothetical protein
VLHHTCEVSDTWVLSISVQLSSRSG